MARYAEGTKVSVDSSRGEIMGLLAKHGVTRQATGIEPEGDTIQFELNGRVYRLLMKRPTAEEMLKRDGRNYSYPHNVDWQVKAEAEWRRRWRANVLLLKAKLEFADDGDTTNIEREMLPYLVLQDGSTLESKVAKMPLMIGAGKGT